MASATDISSTIIAKSDQLNSDDLISGPIIVKITEVKIADAAEQPVSVGISGGYKPYFPCKTCRRVLVSAWGKDATKWVGRVLKLYRDPKVKWGGEVVGGIRIAAMSDIPQKLEIALAETRGKKKLVIVEKLTNDLVTQPASQSNPIAESFNEMKARWKSRREALGMLVNVEEFGAFVEAATSGLILAKDARNLSHFDADKVAQCGQSIEATLQEPL